MENQSLEKFFVVSFSGSALILAISAEEARCKLVEDMYANVQVTSVEEADGY